MGKVIAMAGKGGTGKTTLSALIIRYLKEKGMGPILAVDADPNSNLAEALGVDAGRPLAEIVREPGVIVAMGTVVFAQLVMTMLMVITSLHMKARG